MEPNTEVAVPTGTESPQAAEPTETPAVAPEVSADATVTPEAPSKPADPDAEAKKALRGVQKRINELTRERYEAEERGKREAEHWRQEALKHAQQAEQLRQAAPGPKWDQYQDLEQYTAARSAWEAERIVQARMAEAEKTQHERQQAERQQQAEQQARQRFEAVVTSKIQEAEKKYPDFIDVVSNPELPGLQGTAAFNAILDSDAGAEVMYYLGKNPAKAHQIVTLSPLSQVREIGRIEAAIQAGSVVSRAPPPAEAIGNGKGGAPKDMSRMSYEEFVKERRKQIAQRR